jgi:hypothetical protein
LTVSLENSFLQRSSQRLCFFRKLEFHFFENLCQLTGKGMINVVEELRIHDFLRQSTELRLSRTLGDLVLLSGFAETVEFRKKTTAPVGTFECPGKKRNQRW